jgi:hypothetical protein
MVVAVVYMENLTPLTHQPSSAVTLVTSILSSNIPMVMIVVTIVVLMMLCQNLHRTAADVVVRKTNHTHKICLMPLNVPIMAIITWKIITATETTVVIATATAPQNLDLITVPPKDEDVVKNWAEATRTTPYGINATKLVTDSLNTNIAMASTDANIAMTTKNTVLLLKLAVDVVVNTTRRSLLMATNGNSNLTVMITFLILTVTDTTVAFLTHFAPMMLPNIVADVAANKAKITHLTLTPNIVLILVIILKRTIMLVPTTIATCILVVIRRVTALTRSTCRLTPVEVA